MKTLLAASLALLAVSRGAFAGTCAPSTFIRAETLSTSYQPVAVAAGQFDGDAHPDLVVTTQDGEILVYLGAGDGSFGAEIESSAPFSPAAYIATGHFDADANLDVAVPTFGQVAVLLGNGDGTFQAPVYYNAGQYPTGLVAADLTGDGKLDLIETSGSVGGLVVLPGNGNGTFGASVEHSGFPNPGGLAVGDFNDDAKLDVAMTVNSTAVAVLLGTGGGALGPATIIKVGGGLAAITAADLNDDTILDLAVTTSAYVGILRGNGDGTFRAAVEYPSGFVLSVLVPADLDGDGKTDLVGLRTSYYYYGISGIVVPMLQQSNGSFSVESAFVSGVGSLSLTTEDFNEDGHPDFATADTGSSTVSILFGEGENQLQAPTFAPVQGPTQFLLPGDFDGDGHPDLLTVGTNYDGPLQVVRVLDRSVSPLPSVEVDSYPISAAATDFDHDGSLDLAVLTQYSGLRIFPGNGDGTFQEPVFYSISGNTARWIVAGDFNGDGFADVAIQDFSGSGSQIETLLNDGTGQLMQGPAIALPHGLAGLIADRLDPGPTLDLAGTNGDCCDQSFDTVLVLHGNGDGSFQTPVEYPTGSRPAGLAAGFLNGDKAADLVVANSNDTNLTILLNDGNGGFQPTLIGIGWSPAAVTMGDFDNDGKTDVATVNPGSSNASVLLGTGDGGFQAPVTYPAPGSSAGIAAVNFGGQGPDLAISAPGDNALEILFNANLSVQTLYAHTVLLGGEARFVGGASGSGILTYQWNKNGSPLSDGANLSGSHTAVLTIQPAEFSDGAAYSVTVSDSCGTVTSNAVSLYVEFADVPSSSPFHNDIISIATAGITGGCGGSNYCPTSPVRRDQMAVFLLKSEHGSAYTPPACTGIFADVPCPGPFTDWVEQLAAEEVTGGCGGANYCPDSSVTRAQMAIFLLKTSQGSSYTPPPAVGIFGDVPVGSFGADFIEDLYNKGITGGCQLSPLLYCPGNAVLRQQMATFLVRAFFP
jgi:FG-GAP-like repeat/Immunoglobulin I-set domain